MSLASESSLSIRDGRAGDGPVILELWDRAVAWLVARGQPGQWGTAPVSARERTRDMVDLWVHGSGLRIAEMAGAPVGVSVIGHAPPAHVPPVRSAETYLHFLLSDRDHAGRGIGAELVRRAAADARAAGSAMLRVDCWAGAPELVAWYERQGFVRSDTFTVDAGGPWHGQVFEMQL